jgi:hypothetical protein
VVVVKMMMCLWEHTPLKPMESLPFALVQELIGQRGLYRFCRTYGLDVCLHCAHRSG